MEKKDVYRWIRDYTHCLNLNNIEWLVLSEKELHEFFYKNYLDDKTWTFVTDNCFIRQPLGMPFMRYDFGNLNNKYFIGVCQNIIGKKTIIGCINYRENHRIFTDQKIPLTYILTIEVNTFFRNKGISKKLCRAFGDYINPNQHVLSTPLSDMGRECKIFDTLKHGLIDSGFSKSITLNEEDNYIYSKDYHDTICEDELQLKMK